MNNTWIFRGFPIAQCVKNPPAMQETQVRSLGQEDPLDEEMAIHSNILAWRIPWTGETDGLQSMGHKDSDMTEQLNYDHPLGLRELSLVGKTVI